MRNDAPPGILPDTTEYRADIQGIRALAVLSVIFYHGDIIGFPGGFVGVDIFFVISGFLITRLLMRELETTGSISVFMFWGRRVRRLLPNASVTLLAVLTATVILLPAYRRPDIALDVIASAAFVSNYHFATNAVDYFRLGAPPSPVLHFWSLSVEEQYYVVWPLLLLAVCRLRGGTRLRTARTLLFVVFGLSFVSALVAVGESQPVAFFHAENRVWQLALGGILATHFQYRLSVPAQLRALLGWLGLAAMLFSITAFDDDLAYPGFYALMPTLGTAALLAGVERGGLSGSIFTILASSPMRWIGDRSYSLYPVALAHDRFHPEPPSRQPHRDFRRRRNDFSGSPPGICLCGATGPQRTLVVASVFSSRADRGGFGIRGWGSRDLGVRGAAAANTVGPKRSDRGCDCRSERKL